MISLHTQVYDLADCDIAHRNVGDLHRYFDRALDGGFVSIGIGGGARSRRCARATPPSFPQ